MFKPDAGSNAASPEGKPDEGSGEAALSCLFVHSRAHKKVSCDASVGRDNEEGSSPPRKIIEYRIEAAN